MTYSSLTAFVLVASLLAATAFAGATEEAFADDSGHAITKIRALTHVIDGHSVGGVAIDLIGNIYVADFADVVWKITPEGERQEFASGLYGASGNAIDRQGNLLQSNCHGDSIVKVDRKGEVKPFVSSGLNCPIGIAVNTQTNEAYVANCGDNTIAKISPDGSVTSFAKSDLLRCPNGISIGPKGNLYVVNFRDNKMLRIDSTGSVASFATVSKKGLGHLCFKNDRFYVTRTRFAGRLNSGVRCHARKTHELSQAWKSRHRPSVHTCSYRD